MLRHAVGDGKVGLVYTVIVEHAGEHTCCAVVARNDQHACGVLVQAMDEPVLMQECSVQHTGAGGICLEDTHRGVSDLRTLSDGRMVFIEFPCRSPAHKR